MRGGESNRSPVSEHPSGGTEEHPKTGAFSSSIREIWRGHPEQNELLEKPSTLKLYVHPRHPYLAVLIWRGSSPQSTAPAQVRRQQRCYQSKTYCCRSPVQCLLLPPPPLPRPLQLPRTPPLKKQRVSRPGFPGTSLATEPPGSCWKLARRGHELPRLLLVLHPPASCRRICKHEKKKSGVRRGSICCVMLCGEK